MGTLRLPPEVEAVFREFRTCESIDLGLRRWFALSLRSASSSYRLV